MSSSYLDKACIRRVLSSRLASYPGTQQPGTDEAIVATAEERHMPSKRPGQKAGGHVERVP
eukprot:scaffold3273_cov244-Pinguiococcus_pyrenoidosus.AAC.1